MVVGLTTLNWCCCDNEPDMPSAAPSFLCFLLDWKATLCRYKENDVAVGQPRRFCFCLLKFNFYKKEPSFIVARVHWINVCPLLEAWGRLNWVGLFFVLIPFTDKMFCSLLNKIRIFAKSSRRALAVMQNPVLSLARAPRKPRCIHTFLPFSLPLGSPNAF